MKPEPFAPAARNGIDSARHAAGIVLQTPRPQGGASGGSEPARHAARRCRLCGCILGAEDDDDLALELCVSCKARPEARRLGLPMAPSTSTRPSSLRPAREFTEAERALIRKVHGFMPMQHLLALLNERLACDLGPDATPYTMDQLHAAIGSAAAPAATGTQGWATQRKLIAQARRAGVLDAVSEQLIDDFAVVFSLNPKQVLGLRDALLPVREEA